jgi:hypothetical protein
VCLHLKAQNSKSQGITSFTIMKLLARLPFCYFVLVLLTLNNGVNNVPISAGYSLNGFDSNENADLADFTIKQDCLKRKKDEEDKVDGTGINNDFSSKTDCKPQMNSDYNAMSNDVPVSNHSTDKHLTHNNRYNTTCTRNRSDEYNEVSESDINILVPPYNFIDGTNELIFEKSDDNVGVTIADDIVYEDMPGVLIFYVVNDDGETHNIEVENTVKLTGDDIRVNFSWVLQALADFISDTEKSSEEEMEWTEDSELEEPQRFVENGYILYDMGESS